MFDTSPCQLYTKLINLSKPLTHFELLKGARNPSATLVTLVVLPCCRKLVEFSRLEIVGVHLKRQQTYHLKQLRITDHFENDHLKPQLISAQFQFKFGRSLKVARVAW